MPEEFYRLFFVFCLSISLGILGRTFAINAARMKRCLSKRASARAENPAPMVMNQGLHEPSMNPQMLMTHYGPPSVDDSPDPADDYCEGPCYGTWSSSPMPSRHQDLRLSRNGSVQKYEFHPQPDPEENIQLNKMKGRQCRTIDPCVCQDEVSTDDWNYRKYDGAVRRNYCQGRLTKQQPFAVAGNDLEASMICSDLDKKLNGKKLEKEVVVKPIKLFKSDPYRALEEIDDKDLDYIKHFGNVANDRSFNARFSSHRK